MNEVRIFQYCDYSGKRCYSEREAGSILNSLKHHQNGDHCGRRKEVPRRKYYCRECGCFHLTHYGKYFSEDERGKREWA